MCMANNCCENSLNGLRTFDIRDDGSRTAEVRDFIYTFDIHEWR